MAAKIATEMNGIASGDDTNGTLNIETTNEKKATPTKPNDPVVIGGSIIDLSYSVQDENLQVS